MWYSSQDRNLFFSPHSVWCAVSLAYFGAEGSTLLAMQEAMGLTNLTKVDVMRAFRFIHFWQDIRKMEDGQTSKNTLRVANRCAVRRVTSETFLGAIEAYLVYGGNEFYQHSESIEDD